MGRLFASQASVIIKCIFITLKHAVNHNYRPLTVAATLCAVPIAQAVENSAALGHLTELVKESSARLKAVSLLIPAGIRPAIKAGPIDGQVWCLLVTGNAAAAKLRQLSPLILSKLISAGEDVTSIRLKILTIKP